MDIIAFIFSVAVGIVLFVSGILKILSLKESAESIIKMELFPRKVARLLGVVFPFVEVFIAVLLVIASNYIIVNIFAIIIILSFIILNYKAIIEYRQEDCYCFGKHIKSKMGYGGLVQSSLLVISLIPNIIFNGANISTLLTTNTDIIIYLFVFTTAFSWALALFLFRIILELLFYPAKS